MAEKKLKQLPLGISDFRKIIDGDYVYVDKTQLIYQMITSGDYYFLSRPRRFGKSLLISTLEELFTGNKDLFSGLWIANSDYNWQEHPIIHFDFSDIDHADVHELRFGIQDEIENIAQRYDLSLARQQTIGGKFKKLIQQLSQQNKVVILIDEYDKPILDHIDNPEEAKSQREVLKSLYSVIKGSGKYLRFVMLTGVTKFAKASIFSGLNNLRDISLSDQYATLLGYTQKELIDNFANHLELLVPTLGETASAIVTQMDKQYDGYRFARQAESVFNPYSVLTCLTELSFGDYWSETGIPTFLITLLKTNTYDVGMINKPEMTEAELGTFDIEDIPLTTLLFQAGYLTIKNYNKESGYYTLDFPNSEVTKSFNALLAKWFTRMASKQVTSYASLLIATLNKNNISEFEYILQNMFNEIPYIVQIKLERDLEFILFSMCKLIGIDVDTEVMTSLGRIDLVLHLQKAIYLIELKIDQSADIALQQISDRRYYEKYLSMKKQIMLLGLNFDTTARKVSVKVQST